MTHFKYTFIFPEVKYPFNLSCDVKSKSAENSNSN